MIASHRLDVVVVAAPIDLPPLIDAIVALGEAGGVPTLQAMQPSGVLSPSTVDEILAMAIPTGIRGDGIVEMNFMFRVRCKAKLTVSNTFLDVSNEIDDFDYLNCFVSFVQRRKVLDDGASDEFYRQVPAAIFDSLLCV